jgi:class 3 adenylate cyclase/tetratricopeptide (TPR) repeat protein
MTYKPKPIDTSLTKLPKDVDELTEILARNTHDLWAQTRIAEGWNFGLQRNDARKEHPGLVPYEDLLESEKSYDRKTAIEAIKALLARGYRLEAPTRNVSDASGIPTSKRRELLETRPIELNFASQDKATLLSFWAARDFKLELSAQTYRAIAERFLGVGEPLAAYDVAAEGLLHFDQDVRLRQLHALALARCGAIEKANAELKLLYNEGYRDEETLGILASTHKNMALATSDLAMETRHLAQAFAYYAEAYKLSGEYYSGINAATMAVLLGDKSRAEALARDVQGICQRERNETKTNRSDIYWLTATQGEAALILGDYDGAEECYEKAMQLAGKAWGNRQTSLRQARLLVSALAGDRERVERWFRIPRVVVFVGHMIDQPGRALPRFPPQLEPTVSAAIRDRLGGLDAGFGYASAACGSDILFHEAMLELGGEIKVCLPYNRADFVTDSVDIVPGTDWSSRFDKILARDPNIQVVSPERLYGRSIVYGYANRILQGLASERADQLGVELIYLAVWDKKPGDGPHGTASTVKQWRSPGNRIEIIDLAKILRRNCPQVSSSAIARPRSRHSPKTGSEFSPEIVSMLFADAKGFSKLSEQQVPLFVRHFWGLVREMLASTSHAPINCNTWGDALYFVFSKVRDAGHFALDLSERVSNADWLARGLPPEMALRIGLHTGPAYACIDPVTARKTYIGAQVSRAARIEPITPPGAIYVSQHFAALAKADQVTEFHCDYVGQTSMAKGYGTYPLYVLRRNKV